MSYEGRSIYICSNGHVTVVDAYDDYDYSIYDESYDPKKIIKKSEKLCEYCNETLERVGGVDDTNGEAVASFYKKIIRPNTTHVCIEGTGKNSIKTIKIQPEICEIVRGKPGEFFNYDTGKKLNY